MNTLSLHEENIKRVKLIQAKRVKALFYFMALLGFALALICIALFGEYMETRMRALGQKLEHREKSALP